MFADRTEDRLAAELRALKVRCGGVLLVHCSLRAMGPQARQGSWRPGPSGAEKIVRALLAALGERGTLLMPALSFMTVGSHHPVFDVLRTPSCVGALAEHFRTRAGTIRSVHPTHSVCGVGPRAAELLADHHLDHSPCGQRSPFRRLPEVGGQLLFVGCGLRPNTSMHAVEETLQPPPPYYFGPEVAYRIVRADGSQTALRIRSHSFAGWRQRYDRLADLLGTEEMRVGPLLDASCHLIDCQAMWQAARAAYEKDPFHFVEPLGTP